MKKIMKILVTTLCLCLVTACGARDKDVNLEKSGTKYSTDDGVSFYYPSNYEITANATDTDTVEFSKDNNTLYFKVIKDETDNVVEDKDELYTGEIEQSGASEIEVSKPVLDSGLDVYQYVFVHSDTGIRAKEIVYFSDDKTYIYGYRAAKDDFEDNDKDMTVYLQSFSMATGK